VPENLSGEFTAKVTVKAPGLEIAPAETKFPVGK
jgi:hypothetical protein